MRQTEITIGMQAAVKIGQRLAVVTVTSKANHSGGRRQEYWCRTHDTGRMIHATAARLRPMPGTPEAAAEKARRAKAAARRIASTHAGTYTSSPAPAAPVLVAPSPVAGMVETVNPWQPVERLVGRNREMVEHIVAGVDVALPWSAACRAVFAVIGKGGRLRGFPRPLRRGAWLKVAEEHAANRRLYIETMGHAPVPSEGTITAALTGDAAARAAVLAG